ncbi:DMT family transporter [Alicyclobacillus tolerans]|uniref:EamA family transporter n=1 Tax=Alicyclobacillus tolerans TaxID=90970 RepID=UPI001F26F508|nr:DMT family transporter [Alicyclobacillus tolerans]MCF8566319.1 DMT family transporter [Alicyclobacillus tolerans]
MFNKSWYALFMLMAGSSFGVVSPILKMAYRHGFSAAGVTNAQYVFGAVLLWPIAWLFRKGNPVTKRQGVLLGVLGLCGALTSYAYYVALTKLPASLAIVLLFQFSWIVVVIDMFVRRKLPPIEKWIGLVLILFGTVLAVGLIGTRLTGVSVAAVVLGLCSAIGYAGTLYLSEFVDTQSSPFVRSAIIVTISGIVIMFFMSPKDVYSPTLWHGLWFWGLAVAFFAQALPLVLTNVSIPRIGGRMAGILGSIELPVAIFLARVVLGEHVSVVRWIGVLLILVGIAVSETVITRKLHRAEMTG